MNNSQDATSNSAMPPQLAASAPIVVAPQALTVQLMPQPKGEWWEGTGVLPAIAALVAVGLTVWNVQRTTRRQIEAAQATTDRQIAAAAAQSTRQLEHATQEAKEERRHAAEQAKDERAYAARQAELDRLLDARKMLYAELIDDYVKVQGMMGSMAQVDLDVSPDFSRPLQEMSASVNKTWLLSEVETALLVRDFYSSVNEAFFRLLKKMPKLQNRKREIKSLKETLAKASAEQDAIRAKLQAHIDARMGAPFSLVESSKREEFEHDFENTAKWVSDITEAIFKEEREHSDLAEDFKNALVAEQNDLMKGINAVMAAARWELGLHGDSSALEQQSELMSSRAEAAMRELVNKDVG